MDTSRIDIADVFRVTDRAFHILDPLTGGDILVTDYNLAEQYLTSALQSVRVMREQHEFRDRYCPFCKARTCACWESHVCR